MKRAAIYIRVSSEEQALTGYSLGAQRTQLLEYAEMHGYKVVDIYADEGISARKSINKRLEFQRMFSDLDNIDIILFIKLDRWFRNVADYYKYQEILDKNNVQWISTMENYDTTTANGRLNLNIKLSIAQDEADRTSERIRFVQAEKVKRGEVISGSAPFGMKIVSKKMVPDEETRHIVEYSFNEFLKTQSMRKTRLIVLDKFQKSFSPITFKRLLTNEFYIGKNRSNANFCEPIIDLKTFNEVGAILSKYSRNVQRNNTYLFSGLITCPSCGSIMYGQRTKKNRAGAFYNAYRCPNAYRLKTEYTCKNTSIVNEDKLLKQLLEIVEPSLQAFIFDYNTENKIVDNRNRENVLRNKIEKLNDLYINDLIERDSYMEKRSSINQELESIKATSIAPKDMTVLTELMNKGVVKAYNSLHVDKRKSFWRSIIQEIKVQNPTILKDIIF